ncbi:sec-independent protein translocase protein TatA [Pedobacter hartonius]|uniref:Sec-independent protein translocase protein TatA n=2 Tax=Pedobacter hartonius TaxID=425514 RepID=A0A1H3X897_9SPHI|nr:sec-independent protein translocase protein TatA [Pedobacter hartonius]
MMVLYIQKLKHMSNPFILAALGTPEILVILVVVLLLFGGKKIPELMKGLGQGIKEFKDGQNGNE